MDVDDIVEVIYDMEDSFGNKSIVRFKRNENGNFVIDHYNKYVALAFSNMGLDHYKEDLEWEADECNWDNVESMLKTGHMHVVNYKIKRRKNDK